MPQVLNIYILDSFYINIEIILNNVDKNSSRKGDFIMSMPIPTTGTPAPAAAPQKKHYTPEQIAKWKAEHGGAPKPGATPGQNTSPPGGLNVIG